jgi:hypothetical protein
MCPQAEHTLAAAAAAAIRSGHIAALKQALAQDHDLAAPPSTDIARSCTSPPTGPATFRTTRRAWPS